MAGYLRLVVRVLRRLESLGGGAIVAREHVGVVPGEGLERGDAAVDLAAVVAAAVIALYDGLVIGDDDAASYETWRDVVVGCPCAAAENDL